MSTAAITPFQKVVTVNPSTNLGTTVIMNPFIIMENNPKVSRLIGRARILRIGRTNIFNIPSARAANTAVFGSAIVIYPVYFAIKNMASVSVAHLIIIFIYLLYYIHSKCINNAV